MRTKHLLWTAVLGAMIAVLPTGGAQAAVDGKGSADAALTILGVQLGSDGSVLSVRLLGDDAASTIDGARSSAASLRPLTVTSDLLPVGIDVPAVGVSSTGGEASESTETLSLDTLATSGSLEPASLTAVVDQAGARSGINSALVDLGAAGGLLDVESVGAALSTDAASDSSSAIRSVEVDALTVINLGALLEGLGVNLEALPLDALYGLLSELGVQVEGVGDATAVEDLLTTLNGTVDTLQAMVDGTTDTIDGTLCSTLDSSVDLTGTLLDGTTCSGTLTATDAELEAIIDAVQAELSAVLGSILGTLDGTALLAVDGVTANVAAVANDTVAGSSAVVEAVIGPVSVGGLTIPGLDTTATAEAVNQLVEDAVGKIDSALATVSPELAGVIDLDVLEITRSIEESGGYVTSTAGLTALRATITPPDLAALLDGLTEPATQTLGVELPTDLVLAAGMDALEAGLGDGTVEALSGPSTVEVVALSNTAAFSATLGQIGSPPGGGEELPRTGGTSTVPLILGVALAGTAVGLRRLLRTSRTTS